MSNVKALVNLSLDADKALDRLAERARLGRSEVVRQLITLGEKLLATPYSENELEVWHSIRALRAQLGDEAEYRKEYPRG